MLEERQVIDQPRASGPLTTVVRNLEGYFEFQRLKTDWKTEVLAGFTTFITMAYIVLVNPSILRDAGMPLPGVFAATCLSAALGTLLMGAVQRQRVGGRTAELRAFVQGTARLDSSRECQERDIPACRRGRRLTRASDADGVKCHAGKDFF